jgi:hypothetical protein
MQDGCELIASQVNKTEVITLFYCIGNKIQIITFLVKFVLGRAHFLNVLRVLGQA